MAAQQITMYVREETISVNGNDCDFPVEFTLDPERAKGWTWCYEQELDAREFFGEVLFRKIYGIEH